MRTIPLTQGKVAVVDDDDFEYLSAFRWHAVRSRKVWYASRNIPREGGGFRALRMHKAIVGEAPSGKTIDHADGDGLNNRRVNLRFADRCEQMSNRSRYRNNSTGFKGVYARPGSADFTAYVSHRGKAHYLGRFKTATAAAEARNRLAVQLHGAFARVA